MVRRRRNTGRQSPRKSPQKRGSRRSSNQSLKEKVLTTAIWGLSLINIALIFSLVSNFFASPNEFAASANQPQDEAVVEKDERVTVEVLNACGVQGLANDVTQYLRNHNFDVVNVGNYSSFNLDRTLIFDRVSLSSRYARKVASVLDVDENQVVPDLEDSLHLMVTVIVGKDYKTLSLFTANR
ncbi:MAG: LytR C-terminal domain-containing protein [bacterium]